MSEYYADFTLGNDGNAVPSVPDIGAYQCGGGSYASVYGRHRGRR